MINAGKRKAKRLGLLTELPSGRFFDKWFRYIITIILRVLDLIKEVNQWVSIKLVGASQR